MIRDSKIEVHVDDTLEYEESSGESDEKTIESNGKSHGLRELR
jgi:hypothetical protein